MNTTSKVALASWTLLLLASAPPAQERTPSAPEGAPSNGLRLVPADRREPPPPTPLPWAPSFAAAQAAAKEKQQTLLLYFTATW